MAEHHHHFCQPMTSTDEILSMDPWLILFYPPLQSWTFTIVQQIILIVLCIIYIRTQYIMMWFYNSSRLHTHLLKYKLIWFWLCGVKKNFNNFLTVFSFNSRWGFTNLVSGPCIHIYVKKCWTYIYTGASAPTVTGPVS